MEERQIAGVFAGIETMDGAGVKLLRLFSHREAERFDPFLLLDLLGSTEPDEYLPGFPRHPHRGIDTVTYMLEGTLRHVDSMGNEGFIGPGDVQWMTAGSGIAHEEMPQPSPLGIRAIQLWVNLPRSRKMCDPAYRGYDSAEIPSLSLPGGDLRVITGTFGHAQGPIQGLASPVSLFDIRLGEEGFIELEAPRGETAFACVYSGYLVSPALPARTSPRPPLCCLFGPGDRLRLKAGPEGASFLLARGRPLGEDLAWRGGIVMNSEAELDQAFREYAAGGFVGRR